MIAGVSEIKDSASFSIADMKLKEAKIEKIKQMDVKNEKHRKKLYDYLLGQDCDAKGDYKKEIVARIQDLMIDYLQL